MSERGKKHDVFSFMTPTTETNPLGLRAFDVAASFATDAFATINALQGTTVILDGLEGKHSNRNLNEEEQVLLDAASEMRESIDQRLSEIRSEIMGLSNRVAEVACDVINTFEAYRSLEPQEEKTPPSGY